MEKIQEKEIILSIRSRVKIEIDNEEAQNFESEDEYFTWKIQQYFDGLATTKTTTEITDYDIDIE